MKIIGKDFYVNMELNTNIQLFVFWIYPADDFKSVVVSIFGVSVYSQAGVKTAANSHFDNNSVGLV